MSKEKPDSPAIASEELIRRVRGEFYEMPGLRLTIPQACRLWQLHETTCEAILARLVAERVLSRSADGFFTSVPHPSDAMARTRRRAVREPQNQ